MVSNYVHRVTLPTGVSVSQSLLLHRCTGRWAPNPRAGGTSDGRKRKQQYLPSSKYLPLEVQHLGNPQAFFREAGGPGRPQWRMQNQKLAAIPCTDSLGSSIPQIHNHPNKHTPGFLSSVFGYVEHRNSWGFKGQMREKYARDLLNFSFILNSLPFKKML